MNSKSVHFLALALTLSVLAGCVREQDPSAGRGSVMTIRASLPEKTVTRAGFSVPESGPGLHLAWKEGDCIRVISGGASAVYDIEPGFTDHVASFTGPEVAGTTFDIICPGTYASVAEAEAGNPALTQVGNGSTDHLVFTAKLSGVSKDDLPEITFSDAWVAEHPGTSLNRGGIVKFVLTLPAGVSNPKRVFLHGLGDEDISVKLQNIVLGADRILTAYAQCGWEDVSLGGRDFTVTVEDSDGTAWSATREPDAMTLMAGAQNSIVIKTGFARQLFAGGDGSADDPYRITSARQLDNMHEEGVLKSQQKVYFRLAADIDLGGIDWVPLNYASPYAYLIDFDGDGHTISNFMSTHSSYPSFFGVLYGNCHDVAFANAVIENANGGATGILGSYCGTTVDGALLAGEAHRVHVQGRVYSEGGNKNGTGGLFGRICGANITACSADVEIESGQDYVGGLFGYDTGKSTIRDCWSAGHVKAGSKVGGIGGGFIKAESEMYNCFSLMKVEGSFQYAGILGHANLDQKNANATNKPNNHIEGCIAWNESISSRATDGNEHYSSGVIVGYTATQNYLVDCYRKADIEFSECEKNAELGYGVTNQGNAGPGNPLVCGSNRYDFAYHGQPAPAGATISSVARSLGWSESVWDLSGSVPVLTGAVEVLPPVERPTSGASLVPPGDDALRGLGEVRPTAGNGWTVTSVADGITYYRFAGDWTPNSSTTARYQDVYVVDLDLSNPNYQVKVVYTTPSTECSKVFQATNARAAINGAYEKASIALKVNTVWNGTSLTNYPQGIVESMMPNDYIAGTSVLNWKNEGTFYTDGANRVKIAFDGYDPDTPTKTKTVQEERLFYQYLFTTREWPGLMSSAPMLIQDFNPVGKQFKDLHPKVSGEESEAPYTHQTGLYPRTAVALTEGNHFLMFVCDGRYATGYGGTGMSAYWLTAFIAQYFNPQYALNLDGGGSSTMCVRNSAFASDSYVVNYPCDNRGNGSKIHDHEGERQRDSWIVIVDAQ